MIVVDSNIVAARNFTSSLTSEAKQVEEKDPVWIVPVVKGAMPSKVPGLEI